MCIEYLLSRCEIKVKLSTNDPTLRLRLDDITGLTAAEGCYHLPGLVSLQVYPLGMYMT